MYEGETGRHIIRTGVKVISYIAPFAKKTEGIIGQPEPHYYYHRPIHVLFASCFASGFVVDGIEGPGLPGSRKRSAAARWDDMPQIPPIMVVRAKLEKGSKPEAGASAITRAPRL